MNGRNFLELALLVPGVSPTNIGSTQLFPETSAVPGVSLSVGSQRNLSNNFIVDGLSANDDAAALSGITYGVDAVEQFQVVTSGGQAELGRALGGYVNIVTKSGTNVLHGTVYDYVRDDRFNAKNALSGTRLPMNQAQYGASVGGPIVQSRTFYFANVEQRRLDQSGLVTILDGERGADQRAPGGHRLPGPAGCHRRLSESRRFDERAGQGRSPGQRARSVQRPLQPLRHQLPELARRRRAQRAERVVRARQPRPDDRGQQHADALGAHGARDPRPVRLQRPEGAADRPDRSGGQHRRRRLVRHELGQPDAPGEPHVPGRQQPVAPGRRACVQGRRGRPLQRRSDHLSAIGSRELRVLVAREFPDRDLQQRGLHADVRRVRRCRRPTRTSASTRRTSGKRAPASR